MHDGIGEITLARQRRIIARRPPRPPSALEGEHFAVRDAFEFGRRKIGFQSIEHENVPFSKSRTRGSPARGRRARASPPPTPTRPADPASGPMTGRLLAKSHISSSSAAKAADVFHAALLVQASRPVRRAAICRATHAPASPAPDGSTSLMTAFTISPPWLISTTSASASHLRHSAIGLVRPCRWRHRRHRVVGNHIDDAASVNSRRDDAAGIRALAGRHRRIDRDHDTLQRRRFTHAALSQAARATTAHRRGPR